MPDLKCVSCPAPLLPGPLDIVGDVHGELPALHDLLAQLGYGSDGSHPDQRHLVFVGDLGDRGPDSPGVICLVTTLVAVGRAQCVLGNHELSLLRGVPKPGNGWFFATDHDRARGIFPDCRPASIIDRQSFTTFFASLPLALARPDLRIVHAAWHPESLDILGRELVTTSVMDVYAEHKAAADTWAQQSKTGAAVEDEYRQWGKQLGDEHAVVPVLPAIGRNDEYYQMSNPVRVLTSGVEQAATETFYASGKWRMRRSAFCVDYSAGVRYRERPLAAGTGWRGHLGAVRWPERELVFDDGERLPLRA